MNSTVLNKMSHMKLHGMLRTYQAMLDCNQHHDLTHDELINILIQSEWEDRENKKIGRHLRLAKFRYGATIEEINFTKSRGLDKTQVLRLADMDFIIKKANILITGATGVGYVKLYIIVEKVISLARWEGKPVCLDIVLFIIL